MKNDLEESVIIKKHTAVGSSCTMPEIDSFIVRRYSEKIAATAVKHGLAFYSDACRTCGEKVIVTFLSLGDREKSEIKVFCTICAETMVENGQIAVGIVTQQTEDKLREIGRAQKPKGE